MSPTQPSLPFCSRDHTEDSVVSYAVRPFVLRYALTAETVLVSYTPLMVTLEPAAVSARCRRQTDSPTEPRFRTRGLEPAESSAVQVGLVVWPAVAPQPSVLRNASIAFEVLEPNVPLTRNGVSAFLQQALQGGDLGSVVTLVQARVAAERHRHVARLGFTRGHRSPADIEEVLVDVDRVSAIRDVDAVVVLVNALVVVPQRVPHVRTPVGVGDLVRPGDPDVIGVGHAASGALGGVEGGDRRRAAGVDARLETGGVECRRSRSR